MSPPGVGVAYRAGIGGTAGTAAGAGVWLRISDGVWLRGAGVWLLACADADECPAGVWLRCGDDACVYAALNAADADAGGPGVWLRAGAGVWLRVGEGVGCCEYACESMAGVVGRAEVEEERPCMELKRARSGGEEAAAAAEALEEG